MIAILARWWCRNAHRVNSWDAHLIAKPGGGYWWMFLCRKCHTYHRPYWDEYPGAWPTE